ncbi:MAG: IS1 family transposase, partial [Acidobacteriaceae bacterium]|nr:IS1 family transposase [Acidobacteriaceae bacterium]
MGTQAAAKPKTMNCPVCQVPCNRFGKHRNGLQRFRCAHCGKTYTEEHEKPLGSMTVPMDKALLVLQLLVEGNSIRSTERVTNIDRNTIMKLLVLAAEKCAQLMAEQVRHLQVKDVECDELWGYVGKKEGHKKPEESENEGLGDAYCFVAIERNTKLVINFTLGKRNQATTDVFIEGLRDALEPNHRFQITTDGFQPVSLRENGVLP